MKNINIRGVKRTLNHNLLDYNELEDLYYSFQTEFEQETNAIKIITPITFFILFMFPLLFLGKVLLLKIDY